MATEVHMSYWNGKSDAPLAVDFFNQLAHLLIKGTNYAIERLLGWWLQKWVGWHAIHLLPR